MVEVETAMEAEAMGFVAAVSGAPDLAASAPARG